MNVCWLVAGLAVLVAFLVVVGIVWTVVIPIAVLLGALTIGIFWAGMYYGLTRARRSSDRD